MSEDNYICPICNNNTLEEGEKCDVGWGSALGVKIGPDHCYFCSYVESEMDFEYFQKCWELQIDPYPPRPISIKGTFDTKYLFFFVTDKAEALGQCHHQCLKMVEIFPELRIVMGYYYDLVWGEREHYWCIDENNIIVDPTAIQFPTNDGHYSPKRFMDSETLKSELENSSVF